MSLLTLSHLYISQWSPQVILHILGMTNNNIIKMSKKSNKHSETRWKSTGSRGWVCVRLYPQSIIAMLPREWRLSGEGVLFGERECLSCIQHQHKKEYSFGGVTRRGRSYLGKGAKKWGARGSLSLLPQWLKNNETVPHHVWQVTTLNHNA